MTAPEGTGPRIVQADDKTAKYQARLISVDGMALPFHARIAAWMTFGAVEPVALVVWRVVTGGWGPPFLIQTMLAVGATWGLVRITSGEVGIPQACLYATRTTRAALSRLKRPRQRITRDRTRIDRPTPPTWLEHS